MQLTEDQLRALNEIQKFLLEPFQSAERGSYIITLSGCAGSGKTTLTRELVKYLKTRRLTVLGVAPTHKARKVLEKTVNTGSAMTQIPTCTVAALLQKLPTKSYIGSHRYVGQGESKIANYDVIILDEVSMVSDTDFTQIANYLKIHQRKAILVGDPHQIPNPSQQLVRTPQGYIKKDSAGFSQRRIHLNKCIRQDQNPIMVYTARLINYLDGLSDEPDPPQESLLSEDRQTGILVLNPDQFLTHLREHFVPDICRVIAYTNDRVRQYNQLIRQILQRQKRYEVNDLMMGYNNIGFPERTIENGQDYRIIRVNSTRTQYIRSGETFGPLVGQLITLLNLSTDQEITNFFL